MKITSRHRAASIILLLFIATALITAQNTPVLSERQYPKPRGVQTVLVIPVEFRDVGPSIPLNTFETILEAMNAYFHEVSYGRVSLKAKVFREWVRLPHAMPYYGRDSESPGDDRGGNGRGSLQIVYDTISQTDAQIDFSQYNYLIVVHTGEDQAEVNVEAKDDLIWSYTYWDISIPTRDGRPITRASIISEKSPLGVWIHEYLHQLGELPDLWNANDEKEHYIGVWSPMDLGVTLGVPRGSSPPHLTAWSKMKLGWLKPAILPLNESSITIAPLERIETAFDQAAVIPLPDGTYYLIEARERIGFDSHLPAEGVLIYHVDETWDESKVRLTPRVGDDRFKRGAAYGVGDSFFDKVYNVYIDIAAKTFHGYEVRIAPGQAQHLVLEVPNRVFVLQPFTATVRVLIPVVEPKLNLFLDGQLYRTSSAPVDGEYRVDLQFNFDQVGDHVIQAVVVDPVQGTRFETATRIHVEAPDNLISASTILILLAILLLITLTLRRYRRRRRADGGEF